MQSEHRDKVEVSSTLLVSPGCIDTTLSEARKSFKIYILFQESMQKIQLNM